MTTLPAKTVQTFLVELNDTPGAFAKTLTPFREGKIDLNGAWAWSQGDKGFAILIGRDPQKTEATLRKSGAKYSTGTACFCEADDQIGIYHDLLSKIGEAGVNLDASIAVATTGKFYTVFFPKEGESEKLCRTLGC